MEKIKTILPRTDKSRGKQKITNEIEKLISRADNSRGMKK